MKLVNWKDKFLQKRWSWISEEGNPALRLCILILFYHPLSIYFFFHFPDNFSLKIFNPGQYHHWQSLVVALSGLLDKDELENPEWQVPVLREGKSSCKTNWNRRRIGLRGGRKHPLWIRRDGKLGWKIEKAWKRSVIQVGEQLRDWWAIREISMYGVATVYGSAP